MRFSKWRGALLSFVTLYASLGLAHSILRFDTGPFELLPPAVRLIFWPASPLLGFSNTISLSSWITWFWNLESVFASLLLWALVSWPIDYYLKKKGQYWHAGYINRLASWWELAALILLVAAMATGSYYVLQSYPIK